MFREENIATGGILPHENLRKYANATENKGNKQKFNAKLSQVS